MKIVMLIVVYYICFFFFTERKSSEVKKDKADKHDKDKDTSSQKSSLKTKGQPFEFTYCT